MVYRSNLFVGSLSPNQIANVYMLIEDMRSGARGSSAVTDESEHNYGLVPGAGKALAELRLRHGYSRPMLGDWLNNHLSTLPEANPEIVNKGVKVVKTKRPSSFTFRKLTPNRIKAARRLIRDLRDDIESPSTYRDWLTYGLTNLAVNRMIDMKSRGRTGKYIATWLSRQLKKAITEQEAAANRPGKGGRRVAFH